MAIPATPLLARRKVIQVLIETDKGVAETTGLKPLLCFEPVIQPTSPFEQRRWSGKYAGQGKGVLGERSGTCTLRAELRSDGSADLDAGLKELIQACGFKLDTGVYKPTTTIAAQKTVTILVHEDGKKKSLIGAMGNVTIEGEFGKRIFCTFEMTGIWVAPTDEGIATVSHNTEPPMHLAGATLTIGAFTPAVSRFSLNLNNTVEPREDVTAASALAYYMISDRDPVVGMDPEATLVTTHDWNGIWLAGTEAALSVVVQSATDKITIAAPKLQYRELPEGERGGKLMHELTAQCNLSTGDDEVSVTPAAVT